MKKKIFVLVLFIILFYNVNATDVDYHENLPITGRATTQQLNVSIIISGGAPSLTILLPLNSTYLRNTSLILSFLESGASSVWFNLDNNENITLFSNSYLFNATGGTHIINLYANSSDNLITSKNITFSVNLTLLTILYEEFKNQGDSTDFLNYSLLDLNSLQNVTFEIPSYGKIYFYNSTNVTDINSSNMNVIDFDSNIEISQNSIYLNSTYLKNLNKKAELTLRGLSFTNPRILKDGALCSVSICRIESYQSGVLIFNVTEFSTYSAEETPVSPPGGDNGNSGGGGGGGGGGAAAVVNGTSKIVQNDFDLSIDSLVVKIKQGEMKREQFTIRNTGSKDSSFRILIDNVNEYVKLSENAFTLKPGESRTIIMDITASDSLTPNTYMGLLRVSDGKTAETIWISIDVQKYGALLDVKVTIPEKYKIVESGQNIIGEIEIYNLGKPVRVDTILEYLILDENGSIIYNELETLPLETQLNITKKIRLPKNLPDGKYLFSLKTKYGTEEAVSSSWFNVNNNLEEKSLFNYYFVIFIFLVFILLYVLYKIYILESNFRPTRKKKS